MTLLHPVYEFRPLPGFLPKGEAVYRFADGQWLLDDGEYDLAFVANNICLMVDIPYQRNILWKWLDGHWRASNHSHPRSNPWHYALRPGTTEWGGNWGRDVHPNARAGDKGMSWACSRYRCANGRHVDFNPKDPHILAGLLRERESKAVVRIPHIECMYCGASPTDSRHPEDSDGEGSVGAAEAIPTELKSGES